MACYLPENTRERHDLLQTLTCRIVVSSRRRRRESDAGRRHLRCLQMANWTTARDRRLRPNY